MAPILSGGKFIVFEGGEGTGKTTQIKLLEKRLRDAGYLVFMTREPGGNGSPLAEKIRALLKDPANKEMTPETELFLFLASRSQHVKKHIQPHLGLNYIVISDRFYGSTLAYQHFARGLFNLDEVKKINSFATGGLEPDLTIFLDIEPEKGLARIQPNIINDRLDSEALDFHHRVRNGFLTLARTEKNWQIVSADNTIENIQEQIWQQVSKTLNISTGETSIPLSSNLNFH